MKRLLLVTLVSLALSLPTYAAETYADWLKVCALMGTNAMRIVEARDAGVPLTFLLERFFPNGPEGSPGAGETMHALTLEIYANSYWDAAYAQRQIETQCVTQIAQHLQKGRRS